jgi:Putative DNA-binding domain
MKQNPALPVREREGETLELKSRAALAEPETIARGAVAMLNAKGGDIWLGIKAAPGENELEPIPEADAERERRSLQDHLLDTIEPTPTGQEITVTTESVDRGPHGGDGRVLRVELEPNDGHRPYAFRRRGGRHFVRRVGDRTVPMSRDELRELFSQTAAEAASPGAAAEQLRAEAKEVAEKRADRFWLGLEPASPGDLDLRALKRTDLLEEPALSGTARDSYNFSAAAYHGRPRIGQAGGQTGMTVGGDALQLRVLRSGGLRFEAALAETFRVGRVPFVAEERLLSPEALLGYPVSVFRLAGTLLDEHSLWRHAPQGDWWGTLAISGLRGWGLFPGDLANWQSYRYQGRRFDDDYLLLQDLLRFTQEDLGERPEDCAMRLVERIYDAFEIEILPTLVGAALGHARLPVIERDGYSRWVSLDLGGGVRRPARLRRDNLRPRRFEWETDEGSLIPADGRWVHGWKFTD